MRADDIAEKHIPVLLDEIVDSIQIDSLKQNVIVDATLGMGGHASAIMNKMNPGDIFVGFDADEQNLILAKNRLKPISEEKNIQLILINDNFCTLKSSLEQHNIESITGIYYDLGISSVHLDEAQRGFSFMQDGPLDMRLDKSHGHKAADIVNGYTASELRKIFLEYGEEPGANKIAHTIVDKRKKQKFNTTLDLAEVIPGPPRVKARIFQALRIEVNNELENIETSLLQATQMLKSQGRISVISFHSLEDRIVKHFFKKETKDCICHDIPCSCHHKKTLRIITKKPVLPSMQEIEKNQRSRSAKARIAEKI
ncbi:16S rRNA (cytosine(1402)-N(4))-methyltransferase RsmH [Candidatus Gracilibacteria bacterium]|nr:16S rRNA (cytosine(1402)-N(4))-methyltransferase RsmH [Candidatus Gracilibacteria bacterium]